MSGFREPNRPATEAEPNITKDSFDSSSSSVRNSAPRYHFHGLAATQTQTQHDESIDNEGSQKENTPASGELKSPMPSGSGAHSPRQAPPKSPTKTAHIDLLGHNLQNQGAVAMATGPPPLFPSGQASPLKSKSAKAVSFQSPRNVAGSSSTGKPMQTSKTMPSGPAHYYRRSPSLDSFADPLSQDAEKQFIASTNQFDVPLSELGDSGFTQESPSVQRYAPDNTTSTGPSLLEMMSSAYTQEKRRRELSAERHLHGNILVAATPSHSGSSEGHLSESSQNHAGQYDLVETQPSTQIFDDSSEISSSYERLLKGEHSEPPTQVAELDATQPDDDDSNIPATDTGPFNSTMGAPPSAQSTRAPRSLASTVNKPWKLNKLGIPPQAGIVPPSHPGEQELSRMPPPNVAATSSRHRPADTRGSHGTDGQHVQSAGPSDAMDVVPDSEPPQAAPTPAKPWSSPVNMTRSPTKPQPGVTVPAQQNNNIPDSTVVDETKVDESDDDDDIPLAATVLLTLGKGKNKAVTGPSSEANTTIKDSRKTRAGSSAPGNTGRSWETAVVPSSAPEEDAPNTTKVSVKGAKAKSNKPRSKPSSVASSRQTRSTSVASNRVPSKRRRISSDTEDDDELRLTAQDSILIPKAAEKEEEEETEPADEDDMDVDSPVDPSPSVQKRKRDTKPVPKNAAKASMKAHKFGRSTPSLGVSRSANKSSKRLRSGNSNSRLITDPATRVFALWKQDSHYYSGVVHSHVGSSKYLVKFDDGTEDTVDMTKMRHSELRAGDDVILVADNRKAKVKEVPTGRSTIMVEVDDGEELEAFDAEVSDIRIAARTISKLWEDRQVSFDTIIPVIAPRSLKSTPSPSKTSFISAKSEKTGRSRALYKTGFVVTLSVGNDNWEQQKDSVMLAIKNNGGTVVDDWSQIISMEGKHSNTNKRWVAFAKDAKWIGQDNLERVFLLADDANQKPKYLIALALGIPCLSLEWLHDAVNKVRYSAFVFMNFADHLDRINVIGSHTYYPLECATNSKLAFPS